jgi:hypothetical protein
MADAPVQKSVEPALAFHRGEITELLGRIIPRSESVQIVLLTFPDPAS